jgi:hypothetical protein
MYSTCIFCHSPLGANQAVEEFPVGRRLAFDAARGRLWAVCRACGRWNLSPLEERWEAVEACERAFRGTRVRVSTENVGLARLAEGTELVRVGRPLRPEFAAWRYGDQFGARARRAWMRGIAAGGAGAAVVGTALVAGPAVILALPVLAVAAAAVGRRSPSEALLASTSGAQRALLDNHGEPVLRPREMITGARLRPEPRDGAPWWVEMKTGWWDHENEAVLLERKQALVGDPALRAVSVLLARANAGGGSRREVQGAVRRIEHAGDAQRYFAAAEGEARKLGWGYQEVWNMPHEIRLALEMAAHEDAERRALDGELAELERQWRAAEEIAAIADSLAVPAAVEARLRELGASRR